VLDYNELLNAAVAFHGHRCVGQVLGVRLAISGCKALRIEEPRKEKRLIVFAEIDRCATDAIQVVTGCTLGKRTLKYLDYGKMAATFLDVTSGRAVRVSVLEYARERAWQYAPGARDRKDAQLQAYAVMPDEELFVMQDVSVTVRPHDMPGPPAFHVTCQACGERVNDGREVEVAGRTLCRGCAHGSYYTPKGGAREADVSAQRVGVRT